MNFPLILRGPVTAVGIFAGIACAAAPRVDGAPPAPVNGGDYRLVDIEILGSRKDNEIKLSDTDRAIDVTILGSLNFSVLDIDDGTVRIEGAMPNLMRGRSVDYNNDRNRDYEYQVTVGKLRLGPGTSSICLTGALLDGQKFRGCGPVSVTP